MPSVFVQTILLNAIEKMQKDKILEGEAIYYLCRFLEKNLPENHPISNAIHLQMREYAKTGLKKKILETEDEPINQIKQYNHIQTLYRYFLENRSFIIPFFLEKYAAYSEKTKETLSLFKAIVNFHYRNEFNYFKTKFDISDIPEKTILIRQFIPLLSNIIRDLHPYLDERNRIIDLRYMDLSHLNLSSLDLYSVNFEGATLKETNLKDANYKTEQFTMAYCGQSLNREPALIKEINTKKTLYLIRLHEEIKINFVEMTENIAVLNAWDHLLDSQALNNISQLNDNIVKKIIFSLLSSPAINNSDIPGQRASDYLEYLEMGETKNDWIEKYIFLIRQKNNTIPPLEILNEKSHLISNAQAALSAIYDKIKISEKLIQDSETQDAFFLEAKKLKIQHEDLKIQIETLYENETPQTIAIYLKNIFSEGEDVPKEIRIENFKKILFFCIETQWHLDLRAYPIENLDLHNHLLYESEHFKKNIVFFTEEQIALFHENYRTIYFENFFDLLSQGKLSDLDISKYPINSKDSMGRTPYMFACMKNDVSLVRRLTENGGNPHLKTLNGFKIIETMIRLGYTEIVFYLRTGIARIDLIERFYLDELTLEDEENFLENILIVDEKQGYKNNTTLHISAKMGHVNLLKSIIITLQKNNKLHTEINKKNQQKRTALDLAIENEKPNQEIIDILIGAGAQVSKAQVEEWCINKKIPLAKKYLSYAESLSLPSAFILKQVAISLDHINRMKISLEEILIYAAKFNFVEMFQYQFHLKPELIQSGSAYLALITAVEYKNIESIIFLIEKGVALQDPEKKKKSLMLCLLQTNDIHILDTVFRFCAKKQQISFLNMETTLGYPLFYAIKKSEDDFIIYLLKAGADPFIKEKESNQNIFDFLNTFNKKHLSPIFVSFMMDGQSNNPNRLFTQSKTNETPPTTEEFKNRLLAE